MMTMNSPLRIGSRRSDLALAQSRHVRDLIENGAGVSCKVVEIDTSGDRDRTSPLPAIGGKGLFTHELEEQLLAGRIDIAVHSLKDLPSMLPDGLTLGAIGAREDPRDALVSTGPVLGALPAGSRVGTGSLRRLAQLAKNRPDVAAVPIRGNVPTRIQKLDAGEYDAILLAAAGLRRLGLAARITQLFDTDLFIPAPGQGALGVECRERDRRVLDLLARTVNDQEATTCCRAERVVQRRLDTGCNAPVGIHARLANGVIRIVAFASNETGYPAVNDAVEGPAEQFLDVAARLADRLVESGIDEILASARRKNA